MTMDSDTEEEEEEFFETLDVIPTSSPSSDSEGGSDERRCKLTPVATDFVQVRQTLPAEYDIWQKDTSSIIERRQRLFSKMGLRLKRDDSKRALGFLNVAERWPLVETRKRSEGVETSLDSHPVCCPNLLEGLESQHSTSSIVKGDSPGRVERLQVVPSMTDKGGDCDDCGSSGTICAPSQSLEHNSIQINENLVSALVPSNEQSFSASRVEIRHSLEHTIGIHRNHSFQEGCVSSQPNNVGSLELSPDFATPLEEDSNVCLVPASIENSKLSLHGREVPQSMEGIDLLCRIKDLDSGKEFIVNMSGEDGSWNNVRERETGLELTLEEFESSLGFSPIVQELMKREQSTDCSGLTTTHLDVETRAEKKWLKAIKGFVSASRDKNNQKSCSSGRLPFLDTSGRRYSSESNDSRDSAALIVKRTKVHAHRKSKKEFKHLYLRQEIQAHDGAIWAMKFNFDGTFLASAGQDKVVKVWEATDPSESHSPDIIGDSFSTNEEIDNNTSHGLKRLRGSTKENTTGMRSPVSSNTLFLLLEKPKHALCGHTEDVLDLSWSQSQFLLSSSMDKSVRLWNVLNGACLRMFVHNDYVTCIHFNPVDDGYFISGSLDGKVRIWSIRDHQVVDWVDLCEMVTAVCYKQDGQGAVVGSYKGTCHLYKTLDNQLQLDTKFQVQRKRKKRSQGKKITGFQCVPHEDDKILVTSCDSRIRVYDGSKVCSKYIGFKNSKSQISASISSNGAYVICASEDSRVCIWKYYDSSLHLDQKQKSLSYSYEDFFSQHVSIAIPWPGSGFPVKPRLDKNPATTATCISETKSEIKMRCESSISKDGKLVHDDMNDDTHNKLSELPFPHSEHENCVDNQETNLPTAASSILDSYLEDCCSVLNKVEHDERSGSCAFSSERESVAWVEGGLLTGSFDRNSSCENELATSSGEDTARKNASAVTTAWGLAIVTADLEGTIQIFRNDMPA